jgi:hypothetical protein
MLLNTNYALLALSDFYGMILIVTGFLFGIMSVLYGFARFKRLNTRR